MHKIYRYICITILAFTVFVAMGSSSDVFSYGESPSQVDNLRARAESTEIFLVWNANPAEDSVMYYVVHRDTVFPFTPGPATYHSDAYDTSFSDYPLDLNQRYAYMVAAVDSNSSQGPYSDPIMLETSPVPYGLLTTSFRWGCTDQEPRRCYVRAAGTGLKEAEPDPIFLWGVNEGATILKALLYWNVYWSQEPYATFEGVNVGATKVGEEAFVHGYRGDVTHLVTGDGSYDVTVEGVTDGASLVVIYEHDAIGERHVIVNDGLVNEGSGTAGQHFEKTWFRYEDDDSVQIRYILGGGYMLGQDWYYYNDHRVAIDSADGSDGEAWDTDWIFISSLYTEPAAGESECSAHIYEISDSLHWVAAVKVALAGLAGTRDDQEEMPASWSLKGVRPNPSGGECAVCFESPRGGGHVKIALYDASGRLVRTLLNRRVGAGRFRTEWDGRNEQGIEVSSGIFFVHMQAAAFLATRKFVCLE
jgi:hypothetical protein